MKNKKGTSLVELIMYVGILSIVSASVMFFLLSNRKLERNSQAMHEVEFQGAQIAGIISQSIRNSAAINSPLAGNTSASLSLNTDTAAKNPTVFNLAGGKISMTEGAGTAINLNSDKVEVLSLSFKSLPSSGTKPVLHVQFEIKYTNPAGAGELNYQKTFYVAAQQR